jgi:L-alanine-DL-glutamate epimerase-like enolase superfamily enzyme
VVICDVNIHRVAVPRIYTTKVAPAGGHGDGKAGSEYVLIEMMADEGAVGLGEISDIEPEWGDVSWDAIGDLIADAVLGRSVDRRIDALDAVRSSLPGSLHRELSSAIPAAVEAALIDVAARTYGVPVYELLGGAYRSRVAVSWVAYIRGTDELESEIREKVEEGFTAFKLKVGEDHALDLERVKLTRALAGPGTHIRLDASGEWEEAEAVDAIRELASVGVETPIRAALRTIAKNTPEQVSDHAEDVAAALARVKAAVSIPIIEHVADFEDRFALALAAQQAVDVFNVVPCQAGGSSRALRLINVAEAAGIDVLLGSTVELSPGTAMSLHIGVAGKGVTVASDLVGPGLLEGDVCTDPLTYTNGGLEVTRARGLGLELDEDKLKRFAVPREDGDG